MTFLDGNPHPQPLSRRERGVGKCFQSPFSPWEKGFRVEGSNNAFHNFLKVFVPDF